MCTKFFMNLLFYFLMVFSFVFAHAADTKKGFTVDDKGQVSDPKAVPTLSQKEEVQANWVCGWVNGTLAEYENTAGQSICRGRFQCTNSKISGLKNVPLTWNLQCPKSDKFACTASYCFKNGYSTDNNYYKFSGSHYVDGKKVQPTK